ncbi:MAG: hypothetical protein KH208_01415 [Desulfovibrio sp.]|uniref:hypothetical protein n=1 Tax=Desulfovibrio sp. TaxID=885 RepID=UPI0025C1787C|nr:hypothetical protein [Desulfovibrio sp.]MBS6828518.1 hypothetical protein [Desulfovibrio sp.]
MSARNAVFHFPAAISELTVAVIAGNSARPFFMKRFFSASGATRPALCGSSPGRLFQTFPAKSLNKGGMPFFPATGSSARQLAFTVKAGMVRQDR